MIYVPQANANGADSFTFILNDGQLDSAPATVSINITPVNDPPTIGEIADLTVTEDSASTPVTLPVAVGDVDNDPGSLIVSASSDNPVLAPDGGIRISGSGGVRTMSIGPAANQFGTATITVTVSDGQTTSSTAFLLTVNQVNHVPVADARASVTNVVSMNNANALVTLDGSRSYDPDNDPLAFTWLEGGNVIGTGAVGSVTLAPGTHTITLIASDGVASDSATVTVRVMTLAQIIQEISAAVQAADIPPGQKNSLNATLRAAADSSAGGNLSACVNQLRAFENKVNAQAGKKIDDATANDLVRNAQNVIRLILGG